MSEQLNAMEERLIDVGRRSAAPRIASFILRLKRRLVRRGLATESTMPFPLRQSHIADALGLTTVHVNRMLSAFRAEGILTIDQGQLAILRPARFAEIADATDL